MPSVLSFLHKIEQNIPLKSNLFIFSMALLAKSVLANSIIPAPLGRPCSSLLEKSS